MGVISDTQHDNCTFNSSLLIFQIFVKLTCISCVILLLCMVCSDTLLYFMFIYRWINSVTPEPPGLIINLYADNRILRVFFFTTFIKIISFWTLSQFWLQEERYLWWHMYISLSYFWTKTFVTLIFPYLDHINLLDYIAKFHVSTAHGCCRV